MAMAMAMTQSATRILLCAAIEEYPPLYEATWELNAAWPGSDAEANRVIAHETLCDLLRRDWIRLFRTEGHAGDLVANPQRLPRAAAAAARVCGELAALRARCASF